MPIGFEINDYDSDDDISSTEDEIIDLPINDKKNKKLKSKKQKKSILKESKIVKNKAKEKIKSMESEVNDLEFLDNLKEENEKQKAVSFSNDEISGFFTDNELKVQLEELDKLQKYQKHQWKTQDFTHETTQSAIVSNNIKFSMNSMFKKRTNTNSRTKTLSTISRVNTRLPIMKIKKNPKKKKNKGSMW